MKLSAILAALACAALATVSPADAHAPRVAAGVHRTLRRQGTVNLIVTMRDSPASAIDATHRRLMQQQRAVSRGERVRAIVAALQTHAKDSQADITKLMAAESSGAPLASKMKSYWVSNQVYFRDATIDLVVKLAQMPGVAEVAEEQVRPLPIVRSPMGEVSADDGSAGSAAGSAGGAASNGSVPVTLVEWGIARVGAPDVWATGNKGEGVVVGVIDTGVRATHETLVGSYRGQYGWYDPENKAAEPFDSFGHGTHVTGTIAGDYGIGVAPRAQWMMCKGCRGADCFDSDLLACFQFMTCPTDPSGANADCTKAPRVVNNSWGNGQGDKTFASAIATWRAAGIIPIFSIGNNGPECGTATSPGDGSDVISVGATTGDDALASFSNRGPSVAGVVKPEITAPGDDIVSAWGSGDMDYVQDRGSSMAAPHVTGAVALLLSAQPTLTLEDVRARLLATADQGALQPTGQQCGNSTDGVFPNNMYGHGRLNALSLLKGERGPQTTPSPTTTTPPVQPSA